MLADALSIAEFHCEMGKGVGAVTAKDLARLAAVYMRSHRDLV